jgi:D-alanine-D-alanine ligase-like ATP-grasp enzyme
VRRTANLHTGGTLEDVTAILHPTLADAAVRAARALDIPVVGLDLMVRPPISRSTCSSKPMRTRRAGQP